MRKRDCSCYAFLFSAYFMPQPPPPPSSSSTTSFERFEIVDCWYWWCYDPRRCSRNKRDHKNNHNRIKYARFVSHSHWHENKKNILKFNASNCLNLWLVWGFEFKKPTKSISIKIPSISSLPARKKVRTRNTFIWYLFSCSFGGVWKKNFSHLLFGLKQFVA